MNEVAAETVERERERVEAWAEGRIAECMGVVNAATAELVSVVAKVLESGAWSGVGIRSPQHWLSWRAGLSPARADAIVAMARRRDELPLNWAAFAEGRVSEDTMRLVVRRVPPERDAEVADMARIMTVPQLRRLLRSLPVVEVPDPQAEPTPDPAEGKGEEGKGDVSFGHDDDGTWDLRAKGLPTERGAIVQKALEAARDAEFRARNPEAPEGARAKGITWSDALERMALAALEALDPASGGGRAPSQRYQVLVHVRPGDTLATNVHLGPALSTAARRRITCDTDLRWVLEDEGRPVAWGRKRRTVDPVLRKLIEDRDRACRVPWCSQTRWLETHHILHVEDGGETIPENLVGLCPRDHDLHHRGLLGIRGDPTKPDGLVFTDRHGRSSRPHLNPWRPGDHRPRPPTTWASTPAPGNRPPASASTPTGSSGADEARVRRPRLAESRKSAR